MVMHSLSSEFTLLRVVNGEAVAAHNLGVANGFVKPKLGERQPAGAAGRRYRESLAPHSQSFTSPIENFHFWEIFTRFTDPS